MRERILAIGCGGLCLLLLFGVLAVGLAKSWEGGPPAVLAAVVAGIFGLIALAAFAIAIRRGADDEDLFEGNRGLAVALAIVVILSVTGFMVAAYLQPDFWQGVLEGSR